VCRTAGKTLHQEACMLSELWNNMMHSTAAGFVGVIGIFTYMAVILVAAIYRIKKGEHLHH